LLSGLASLLYQTIWLRLAMAHFGVNSHVVAAVLSIFMLGLALGSFGGGWLTSRRQARGAPLSLGGYALIELVIACGGLLVPLGLERGRELLLALPTTASAAYSLASFAVIAVSLLPFCVAMGATFPVALGYLTRLDVTDKSRLFSRLYLMNVAGALAGVVLPLALVELWGFRTTLWIGVAANVVAAAVAWRVGLRSAGRAHATSIVSAEPPLDAQTRGTAWTLFFLGFGSIGLEVIWTRA
jgi:spermidine synthase